MKPLLLESDITIIGQQCLLVSFLTGIPQTSGWLRKSSVLFKSGLHLYDVEYVPAVSSARVRCCACLRLRYARAPFKVKLLVRDASKNEQAMMSVKCALAAEYKSRSRLFFRDAVYIS